MMLHGLEHLKSSKIAKYNLQLSIYAWMLEKSGFIIEGMWLDHYNDKGKYKPITLDYLASEAEYAIKNYNNIDE